MRCACPLMLCSLRLPSQVPSEMAAEIYRQASNLGLSGASSDGHEDKGEWGWGGARAGGSDREAETGEMAADEENKFKLCLAWALWVICGCGTSVRHAFLCTDWEKGGGKLLHCSLPLLLQPSSFLPPSCWPHCVQMARSLTSRGTATRKCRGPPTRRQQRPGTRRPPRPASPASARGRGECETAAERQRPPRVDRAGRPAGRSSLGRRQLPAPASLREALEAVLVELPRAGLGGWLVGEAARGVCAA